MQFPVATALFLLCGISYGAVSNTYTSLLTAFFANYDSKVDLTTGSMTTSRFITWQSHLSGSGRCAKRGVLKISFMPPHARDRKEKVLIDMFFRNPTNWVFNIGDSVSNDGSGGDAGSTSRDAEAEGHGSTLKVWGNDYKTANRLLVNRPNIINDRLTVIIGNGLIIWNNWGAEFNYHLNADFLYALNGQKDSTTPNYDIYLGMNRVIANRAERRGSGLCAVYIKWLS